jgi:Icc-related predicted phosphoesterase
MKILCVSDQLDPLIYTDDIKQRYADVDLVLSAGDLPVDYLDFIASALNKPLFFVFGSNNYGEFESHPLRAALVDRKVRQEAGIIVVGLDGLMRCNKGKNQFTDLEMSVRLLKLFPVLIFNRIFRGRYLDVLLTHASPRGIHDRNDKYRLGFKCFLWFIRVFKPKYHIHGQIHLYDLTEPRTTKYHKTLVINAYSHYLIDT